MSAYVLPATAGLIILIGLAVGFRDLAQFRLRRVRAIAGVSFRESVRRRILWITPLAILGIVAVTQLTRPQDEQDAIRQTIRYSLFATSLIVVVAAVLLAATNLPKEIDSRVIYTIVTKPTTRLEIVLGKALGFAQVSAMILLIMGLFTYGYLRVRAWSMEARIRAALQSGAVDPATEPTLQHYVRAGLLNTKSLAWPEMLQIYSRVPGRDGPRWIGGAQQQFVVASFRLTEQDRRAIAAANDGGLPVCAVADLVVDQHVPTAQEEQDLKQGRAPLAGDPAAASLVAGPELPATNPTTGPAAPPRLPIPRVAFAARDQANSQVALAAADINLDKLVAAPVVPAEGGGQPRVFLTQLSGAALNELMAPKAFDLEVAAATLTVEYGGGDRPVYLAAFDPVVNRPRGLPPSPQTVRPAPAAGDYLLYAPRDGQVHAGPIALNAGDPLGFAPAGAPGKVTAVAGGRQVVVDDDHYLWFRTALRIDPSWENPETGQVVTPAPPHFYSRLGRAGMQIRGQVPGESVGSVGVYEFRNADVGGGRDGKVPLQMKVWVDRGGDLDYERHVVSRLAVRVRNAGTGQVSDPVEFLPETSRTTYVDVPAEAVAGGNFDVIVTGLTPGQMIGLHGPAATIPSAGAVMAEGSFEFNLFKSLLILWLLSVLVVLIALFCSTFLSWPIAVVLTMLLLLGRWGVNELGDALDPGSSRTMATDLFGVRDAPSMRAMTSVGEAMSASLRAAAKVLPDVAQFPVIEDIHRGVSIPPAKVGRAGLEVLLYGLPLLVLTYLIFRSKEVAP